VDQAAVIERRACPTCGVPAGSPCRTRNGIVAIKYHTPRLLLAPELRDVVEVDIAQSGRPWRAPPRVGYACDPADPSPQLDALRAAHCGAVFTDLVGPRVKARPELARAMATAPGATLVVHVLRRLARNSAELLATAAALGAADIRIDLLTGPLAGRHDPAGEFFAVLAAAAELDRDHVRATTRAGQQEAATRGRPRLFDDELLATARALRDSGVPVPEIATRLTVRSGRHPSVASVYRALAEPVAVTP
jgi:DNA invertase Pin-like site-specific DNA recombinase